MALTKVTYSMIDANVINVYDYGATGDGTTDDTAAIQSAFNAVSDAFPNWYGSTSADGPATVYFPRGLYKITSTLNVPRGIMIRGDNARNNGGSQIYQATAGQWIFDLYGKEYTTGGGDTKREADQLITDLFFRSEGGGIKMIASETPSTVLHSPGSFRIDRCYFLNIDGDYAVNVDATELITNCTFDYLGSNKAIKVGDGVVCDSVVWGVICHDATRGDKLAVSNCDLYGGTSAGATAETQYAVNSLGSATAELLSVQNCRFKKDPTGPGFGGVYVGATTTNCLQIIGNTFGVNYMTGMAVVTQQYSTIESGQVSSNIFKDVASASVTYITQFYSEMSNVVIADNVFNGGNTGGSYRDIWIGATNARCVIRDNTRVGGNVSIQVVSPSSTLMVYAEGTFVPTVRFGGVDAQSNGATCYYRINGRTVTVTGGALFDNSGLSGNMTITGWPYALPSYAAFPIVPGAYLPYPAGYASSMLINSANEVYWLGSSGTTIASTGNISAHAATSLVFNFSYQI